MGRVILLALWAVVSRLLGLVRDLSMAWLVGSGWLADALVAATVIPPQLRGEAPGLQTGTSSRCFSAFSLCPGLFCWCSSPARLLW